jgi:hypothetical protein
MVRAVIFTQIEWIGQSAIDHVVIDGHGTSMLVRIRFDVYKAGY